MLVNVCGVSSMCGGAGLGIGGVLCNGRAVIKIMRRKKEESAPQSVLGEWCVQSQI